MDDFMTHNTMPVQTRSQSKSSNVRAPFQEPEPVRQLIPDPISKQMRIQAREMFRGMNDPSRLRRLCIVDLVNQHDEHSAKTDTFLCEIIRIYSFFTTHFDTLFEKDVTSDWTKVAMNVFIRVDETIERTKKLFTHPDLQDRLNQCVTILCRAKALCRILLKEICPDWLAVTEIRENGIVLDENGDVLFHPPNVIVETTMTLKGVRTHIRFQE